MKFTVSMAAALGTLHAANVRELPSTALAQYTIAGDTKWEVEVENMAKDTRGVLEILGATNGVDSWKDSDDDRRNVYTFLTKLETDQLAVKDFVDGLEAGQSAIAGQISSQTTTIGGRFDTLAAGHNLQNVIDSCDVSINSQQADFTAINTKLDNQHGIEVGKLDGLDTSLGV